MNISLDLCSYSHASDTDKPFFVLSCEQPVEHKYIVRILLQHIHIGINLKDILGWWSPHAMDIHYSSNSLKELCTLLSDPEYVRLLKATVEKNTKDIMESNR